MSSETDDVDGLRLSRRTALLGLGAAGTAAWTAPQILSMRAAAAASIPHTCVDCGPDGCDDQPDCGTDSISGNDCSCSPNVPAGTGCSCTQNLPCDTVLDDCDEQTGCPPGYACQVGCCGIPRCYPVCT